MNREAGAADRPLFPSPLYAIFDPSQSRGRPLSAILQDLLAGGVGIIQLRAKETAAKEFLRLAREMRGLTRPAGWFFIVTDPPDIPLAAGADGVHLGQEDLPLAIARKLMGREKIIGISTHDLAQAKEAERGGVDYIGFGPIFGTFTKDNGYSPRGPAMVKKIRQAVKIPIA